MPLRSERSIVGKMRGWRDGLPTLAALLIVATTVSLGRWQLDREQFKLSQSDLFKQASTQPPLDNQALQALIARGPLDLKAMGPQKVKLTGRFDAGRVVFVDNRKHLGVAGMHVVMPFFAEGLARPILVIRGWVPRDPQDRNRLPRFIAPAQQTIEAHLLARAETSLELRAFTPGPDDRLWPNVGTQRFRVWSSLDVQDWVLREGEVVPVAAMARLANSPEALSELVQQWQEPSSGADKHHGYALQWFGLAALTLGLWLYFVVWRRFLGRDRSNHLEH